MTSTSLACVTKHLRHVMHSPLRFIFIVMYAYILTLRLQFREGNVYKSSPNNVIPFFDPTARSWLQNFEY